MGMLESPSDDALYARFREMGREHKLQARRLMGMLGELVRRGVPGRNGYSTVLEFAEREAGLSAAQVELARRLDEAFSKLVFLKRLFEEGLAFPHRLRAVASIACPELDEQLANLVMRLSKAELETWVRDWRAAQAAQVREERVVTPVAPVRTNAEPPAPAPALAPAPAGCEPPRQTLPPGPCPGTPVSHVEIRISAIVHERLLHEQSRLAAKRGRTVSLSELLLHLLDGEDRSRSRYIPVVTTTAEGEPIALRTCTGDVPIGPEELASLRPASPPIDLRQQNSAPATPARSRRPPVAIERQIIARSGGVCEATGCGRPGDKVHHRNVWSVSRCHDPKQMFHLCGSHASLADRGLPLRVTAAGIPLEPAPALHAQRAFERHKKRSEMR